MAQKNQPEVRNIRGCKVEIGRRLAMGRPVRAILTEILKDRYITKNT